MLCNIFHVLLYVARYEIQYHGTIHRNLIRLVNQGPQVRREGVSVDAVPLVRHCIVPVVKGRDYRRVLWRHVILHHDLQERPPRDWVLVRFAQRQCPIPLPGRAPRGRRDGWRLSGCTKLSWTLVAGAAGILTVAFALKKRRWPTWWRFCVVAGEKEAEVRRTRLIMSRNIFKIVNCEKS